MKEWKRLLLAAFLDKPLSSDKLWGWYAVGVKLLSGLAEDASLQSY
jgi:hypothetical protein